jgi:hypothetical protein|nr:hypothetical protein [Alteromonas macleodii]
MAKTVGQCAWSKVIISESVQNNKLTIALRGLLHKENDGVYLVIAKRTYLFLLTPELYSATIFLDKLIIHTTKVRYLFEALDNGINDDL